MYFYLFLIATIFLLCEYQVIMDKANGDLLLMDYDHYHRHRYYYHHYSSNPVNPECYAARKITIIREHLDNSLKLLTSCLLLNMCCVVVATVLEFRT